MTRGSLALGMWQLRPKDVGFYTLANLGVGPSPDGQPIIVKDDEAIARIAEALDRGTLADYVASTTTG